MSSIIKSFRVINKDEISGERPKSSTMNISIKPIIEEARKEAEGIVENAKKQAEGIIEDSKKQSLEILKSGEDKRESFIHNAYEKSKNIFSKAKDHGFNLGHKEGYDLGYKKGYNEGKLNSDELITEALDIKKEYLKNKNELLAYLEKDIIELVTVIYEKLVHNKMEEDNELIISLVLKGIEDLDLNHKLTIITSKHDYDIVQMSRDIILAKSNMISELEIKYDSNLKKGDCILETSKGSIDASLNNQLSEVRELLNSILNNEWLNGKTNRFKKIY